MSKSFSGSTRESLHRMVDRVLDSGRAQIIEAMALTIPQYVDCIEVAEEKERFEKEIALVEEAITLEANRRIEHRKQSVSREAENCSSSEFAINDPQEMNPLKTGRVLSGRKRTMDLQTFGDLVEIAGGYCDAFGGADLETGLGNLAKQNKALVSILEEVQR